MRRLLLLTAIAAVALTSAASAGGARTPFWWWTTAKAKKAVVWSNPQAWGPDHTTILQASNCRGLGRVRRVGRVRHFRDFRCSIVWRNDDSGGGPYTGRLFFRTSRVRPYGVACFSPYSYSTVIGLGCP